VGNAKQGGVWGKVRAGPIGGIAFFPKDIPSEGKTKNRKRLRSTGESGAKEGKGMTAGLGGPENRRKK